MLASRAATGMLDVFAIGICLALTAGMVACGNEAGQESTAASSEQTGAVSETETGAELPVPAETAPENVALENDLVALSEYKGLEVEEVTAEDIEEQLDLIERGFDDIEHRIANLDKEHTRYIRATVTRIHYLLNREDSMKGLVIRILSHLSEAEEKGVLDEDLAQVARRLNVSQFTVISDRSLYRRRRPREDFVRGMAREEEQEELSREDILRMNKIKNRYSRKEIEDFILERMKEGRLEAAEDTVRGDEDFEKLILAYDDAMRKDSPYRVTVQEDGEIDNGSYRYPRLTFELRSKRKGIQEKEDKE